MKRFIFTMLLFTLFLFSVSAEVDLGNFPLGKWLDANYDAVWEFTSSNIRISDPSGELVYDFSNATMEDFSVGAGMDGITLSYYCPETEKTYILTKPVTGSDLTLKIERTGKPAYQVDMTKQ